MANHQRCPPGLARSTGMLLVALLGAPAPAAALGSPDVRSAFGSVATIRLALMPVCPATLGPVAPEPRIFPGPTLAAGRAMPAPIASFDGIDRSFGCDSPNTGEDEFASDDNGAVGPNHFVQSVNFSVAVYDKVGNILAGPVGTATLFADLPGCRYDWSDATVAYDRQADRWVISRFAKGYAGDPDPGGWNQCFAVSQTPDPTGAYTEYGFEIHTTDFNDYPKLGIWSDAYYMTFNENKIFAGTGNFISAFERGAMLSGASTPRVVTFVVPTPPHSGNEMHSHMLPADRDGATPPPAGAPEYIVQSEDDNTGFPADRIQFFEFRVDWSDPSASTLTPTVSLIPASFNSNACPWPNQACIQQPGALSNRLDSLSYGYMMYRLAYRNFGDHEALVFNQTVSASGNPSDNHAGIRWYELRRAGAGSWSIEQQGTYAPDANNRWLGSMAMDQAGDIAISFVVSGASVYPSVRYAGRLASDPPGTLAQPETSLAAGGGSIQGTDATTGDPYIFYGDYSEMTVDPVDDCTFWATNTYVPQNTTTNGWHTRIGSFRFPECGSNTNPPGNRLKFYAVAPCRLIDTRPSSTAPYGGPALAAGSLTSYVASNYCGIPPGARALSANVTVTAPSVSGDLRLFPTAAAGSPSSSINFDVGRTRANNVLFALDAAESFTIQCDLPASNSANVLVDVSGYFQ